jgi:hypothetical protein
MEDRMAAAAAWLGLMGVGNGDGGEVVGCHGR